MTERTPALSRNPNICASCSSLADGMHDSLLTSAAQGQPAQGSVAALLGTSDAKKKDLAIAPSDDSMR